MIPFLRSEAIPETTHESWSACAGRNGEFLLRRPASREFQRSSISRATGFAFLFHRTLQAANMTAWRYLRHSRRDRK